MYRIMSKMVVEKGPKRPSRLWYYFFQILYLIPIAAAIHYCQITFLNGFRFFQYKELSIVKDTQCKELLYLRKELMYMREEMEELRAWKMDVLEDIDLRINAALDNFYSDQIGLFDYAAEYAGGSILSTPNTVPYPSKFSLRVLGTFNWDVDSDPSTILQPSSPGKCYMFYGNKARIRVKLGRPVVVTHISLEHLRIGENLSSSPKEFQILGFGVSDGVDLGRFTYDLKHPIIQTFRVTPTNETFRAVELRILSNNGNDELTCVYRFRVHSLNLNLK